MLALALVVNCLIVFPLTWAMLRKSRSMDPIYGPDSDARRILACLYGAIGCLSLAGLVLLATGEFSRAEALAWALFPLQILYKLGTWPAVGWKSPVVRTNIAVSALLGATLIGLM